MRQGRVQGHATEKGTGIWTGKWRGRIRGIREGGMERLREIKTYSGTHTFFLNIRQTGRG